MNTLDRIKQYIDYKGLSVRQFEDSTGFSNGAFGSQQKKGKTIGVDKLENIIRVYPDLSAEWLLTGEGEMLKNAPDGDRDLGRGESSRNVTDLQHFRDLLTEKFNGLNIYKQKDMAEYLGYNEATFSQIWNGRCGISDRLLLRLKRRLSLDLSGYAFDERKDLFGIPREEGAEEERKGGMIEVPEAVWEVLKEQSRTLAVQSESLAVRDRQVDELIGIIKKREGADLSSALTDAAACADAG